MNKFLLKDKINPPIIQTSVEKTDLLAEIGRALELDRGFFRNLTLIVAPAGYGKTTTLVKYYNMVDKPGCWLTLSEEDNSISRFFKNFVLALQQSIGDFELDADKYFQVDSSTSSDKILSLARNFINEIFQFIDLQGNNFYIFIDELESISSPELNDIFIYMINNLPAGLHLVAAGREEPDWPLIKWKARGKAKVIDHNQLIFKPAEIKKYMANNSHNISSYEAEVIYRITEGWVTGVQFISLIPDLSVKKLKEKAIKVAKSEMVDFLLEEVFDQQPEEIKDILLKTAPLKHFNLELVSYVTGYKREEVENLVKEIYKKQLFLKIIDSKDESADYWYSFHQIFSDGIIKVLSDTEVELIERIHAKAVNWYLEKGLIGEAVQEALKGKDYKRASSIIFMESGELFRQGLQVNILGWFNKIPEKLKDEDPRLIVINIILELFQGRLAQVEFKLKALEDLTYNNDLEGFNENEKKKLVGMVAVASIVYRIFTGKRSEVHNFFEISKQNLSLASYWHQLATIYQGDNQSFFGQLDDALNSYRSIRYSSDKDEYNFFIELAGLKEAVQLWWQGRLNETRHLVRELLYKATQAGYNKSARFGSIQSIYGDLFSESNDLDRAIDLIESGYKINQEKGEILGQQLVLMYKVRYLFSIAKHDELENLFYKIEIMMKEKSFSKLHDNLTGWKARFLLEQDLGSDNYWKEAVALLNSRGINLNTNPVITQEMEFLALARAYLAGGRLKEAEEFALKILRLCKSNKVYRHELESYLILARIYYQKENKKEAFSMVEKAVVLARRFGFFRFILDEGKSFGIILKEFKSAYNYKDDLQDRLIEEFFCKDPDFGSILDIKSEKVDLIEPLSDRELEILKEISLGYSNKKIADRLAISAGTVRWHSSNIYGKLGVSNRTEAVAKGQELGLI